MAIDRVQNSFETNVLMGTDNFPNMISIANILLIFVRRLHVYHTLFPQVNKFTQP